MSNKSMGAIQEAAHGSGFDYVAGSPHLAHASLNGWMRSTLNQVVNDLGDRRGRAPRVLEIGGGHGPFTETLVGAGATVTVTEMSSPSAKFLKERFRNNPKVNIRHDADGSFNDLNDLDAVIYMSVLHHIPDYLGSLKAAAQATAPGGAIIGFQDPLWYPRRTRRSRAVSRAAYLAWRIGRGDLKRGIATQRRRLRGVYDEENPSDMSEYHVVRDGVDEDAIVGLLEKDFSDVDVMRYWSTQSGLLQALGSIAGWRNTFGFVATNRT